MKRMFLTMLMLLCIGHLMIVKAVTSTADSNQALVSVLPETSDISIYRWAMLDSLYMPQPFLDALNTTDGERYVLLMPNNEAMKSYVDAASYNTTTKKMVSMTWVENVFPIRTENYVYNFATATVGRRVTGYLASLNYNATVDYLKMMRMSHTLVLTRPEDAEKGLLSGNRYFTTLDGSVVRVVTDETGSLKAFQGALQMQNEEAGLEEFSQCLVTNAWHQDGIDLYEIAQPVIHSPYSVQQVLRGSEEDSTFAAFYELTCADRQCLADCGFSNVKTLLPYLSSEGEDRLNYTDDKPFTLFVPTNEAIEREIEHGLPTWQGIREHIDAHTSSGDDGSIIWDSEENRQSVARECQTLINFIKAHIMQGVEVADQLPFKRTHASALTDEAGEAIQLEVNSTGDEQMTVSDGKHTRTVLERKNIFTVDKVRAQPAVGPFNSSTIRVFGYHPGIIHQIDGVLDYDREQPDEIDYNDFAFRLLEQMQQKTEGENVVCSPLSMQLAMGMLTNGAAGQTLRQIQQTMGTAGHSVDEVNAYYSQLMHTLGQPQTLPEWAVEVGYTEEHLPQLAFANGIWTCVPLYEQFVKTNQTFYDAELHEGVNFGLQETMDGIDQWVSDKTRGTIPSINEQPNEYITSMLINALYFKGTWETQFENYETSNRIFTNSDGTEVMVPMMYQGKGVAYAKLPTCRAVRLPYFKGDGHGRYYMTVFLPNDDAGDFTLNEEIWKQAQQTQDMQLVALRLPRFTVDAETQMKDVLRDMGIRDAFSGLADFSAMSPVPLCISKIKQLCHIAVDEKGTEASAATVISMESTSIPHIPDYKDFTVDRPFCFTIEDDETGTVLFAGKINQLEQSADVEIGEYQPFAQNGKVWKMGWFYGGSDEAQMVEYHYLDGDTLVGGMRCKKMMRLEVRPSGKQTSYMGAMYEGGRLVYMALPGTEEFYLLYDFVSEKGMRVDVYDPLQNDKAWMVMGATSTSNTERYKGHCQTMKREDSYTFDWMVGVGYVGFYNMPLLTTGSALRLMECRLGDEVLYRDDSLHDGLTPSDAEVRRNKLDFTHVVKSQPKAPRRNAEGTESEALAGEYSVKSFYVNFLPLSGTYTVTLTDGQGTAVYSKQVQTDNVLALEADLSRYAAGDYTLTVENDREAYTAAFSHKEGSGIRPLPSTPRGGDILYDLQGRRLNTVPEKGLYIINGRKIMIP